MHLSLPFPLPATSPHHLISPSTPAAAAAALAPGCSTGAAAGIQGGRPAGTTVLQASSGCPFSHCRQQRRQLRCGSGSGGRRCGCSGHLWGLPCSQWAGEGAAAPHLHSGVAGEPPAMLPLPLPSLLHPSLCGKLLLPAAGLWSVHRAAWNSAEFASRRCILALIERAELMFTTS